MREAAHVRGQAPASFALEVVLSAARHSGTVPDALRLELRLLMNLAGLVRRVGLSLNQAAAMPGRSTQQRKSLRDAADECMEIVRRVDETAERIRRRIP